MALNQFLQAEITTSPWHVLISKWLWTRLSWEVQPSSCAVCLAWRTSMRSSNLSSMYETHPQSVIQHISILFAHSKIYSNRDHSAIPMHPWGDIPKSPMSREKHQKVQASFSKGTWYPVTIGFPQGRLLLELVLQSCAISTDIFNFPNRLSPACSVSTPTTRRQQA